MAIKRARDLKSRLIITAVNRRFGTYRGLARLAVAWVQILRVPRADLGGVTRVVFVCHGNICRSAYATALAERSGLATASCGLSVTAENPAHGPIAVAAARRGLDLSRHRSAPIANIAPRQGDLFLVMEVRQLARLQTDPRFAGVRIDLLGRYGGKPHLHDPYGLCDEFVETSLNDIERSVANLFAKLRASL